jgi:hypothetical protein
MWSPILNVPMAFVAAIPLLGLPAFLCGLALAAADRQKPKYRHVWISITLVLAFILAGLGLSLGQNADF